MTIQILNCASMFPWFRGWHTGAACLLVGTDRGYVLVDTGLGLHDHQSPSTWVRFHRWNFGMHGAPGETAVRQLERMNIPPEQVRDIVLNHLHFDHAGGLPDFPWAQVHVHRREYEALQHPKTWLERYAYDPKDFQHQPDWVLYDQPTRNWFGFDAIPLPLLPNIFLIPLIGHTSGHCGVAIHLENNWLFYCGDAAPVNLDFHATPGWQSRIVLGKHVDRIQAFTRDHPEIQFVAGHMWLSFFDSH